MKNVCCDKVEQRSSRGDTEVGWLWELYKLEQSKIIRWFESPWNQSGRKGKVGKDLLKSQVLSSEWNTERVRVDASGDSEDGEDDELPCVIGESARDCVWRGSRRPVGSSFHRHGAAYLKQRLVIFKEERVDGRARVTIDEERVLWRGWTEIKWWRYWGWWVVRTL